MDLAGKREKAANNFLRYKCSIHIKLAKINGYQGAQFFGELVLCPVCCLLVLGSGFGLLRIDVVSIHMEEVAREISNKQAIIGSISASHDSLSPDHSKLIFA